jgi:AraC-like DNA-binding protein
MQDYTLHEDMVMPDKDFPIRFFDVDQRQEGPVFLPHWHEQLELIYFISGQAAVECGSRSYQAGAGDLVVINSNELHAGMSLDHVCYCAVIIDISLLQSDFPDSCDLKYINPISRNIILFQNKISGETEIAECLKEIVAEHSLRHPAYELAIKSYIYKVLTILLRKYVLSVLTAREYRSRIKNLEQLREVLKYVSRHFTEELVLDDLARMAHLSPCHFCRVFKTITGRSLVDYINNKRINHAELLLKTTGISVTEAAMSAGFNDSNYFSRVYRKYKSCPPSSVKMTQMLE